MDPRLIDFPADRFWARVTPTHGCWQWDGAAKPSGYGFFSRRLDGRVVTITAHRAAYELLVGPIPDGLVIDHLCRNRACVNPAHMELVTSAENTRRGISAARTSERARAQTHCRRAGHPLSGSNVRLCRGADGYVRRYCKACNAELQRQKRAA